MAPERKFVHNYANCGDDLAGLQDLLVANRIIEEDWPFKTRGGDCELFLSEKGLELYLTTSNPFVAEARKASRARVASEEDFCALLPHVAEIRGLLEKCTQSYWNLSVYVGQIFKKAAASGAIISTQIKTDSWHHQIELARPINRLGFPVEDIVEIMGILEPVHNKLSDVKFEYTKKCLVCGSFYQAKGKKALYCSEKCRSWARNHNHKDK